MAHPEGEGSPSPTLQREGNEATPNPSKKEGNKESMAHPGGAKAGEPYQNLDGGRFLPGIN